VSRNSNWQGDVAGSLVGAAIVLTILVVIVLSKIALAMAKEIGRIYVDNARSSSARFLWYALGGLFGIWLLCGVVAALMSGAGTACVYAAAWAFLSYVVSIEVVDWQARPGLPRSGDRGSLDTYLGGLGNVNRDSSGQSREQEQGLDDVAA
jgi:hypothetical protein